MRSLQLFCPVLPPALLQEQQVSCLYVYMFVCLMHGYIFLLYVYLFNKDECWERQLAPLNDVTPSGSTDPSAWQNC